MVEKTWGQIAGDVKESLAKAKYEEDENAALKIGWHKTPSGAILFCGAFLSQETKEIHAAADKNLQYFAAFEERFCGVADKDEKQAKELLRKKILNMIPEEFTFCFRVAPTSEPVEDSSGKYFISYAVGSICKDPKISKTIDDGFDLRKSHVHSDNLKNLK